MKAQTFKFRGELKFLKLMMEDLKDFYSFDDESTPCEGKELAQGNNLSGKENIKNFKELGYYIDPTTYDRVFCLPEEYNEGLAFAKDQLKSKYWMLALEIGKYYKFTRKYLSCEFEIAAAKFTGYDGENTLLFERWYNVSQSLPYDSQNLNAKVSESFNIIEQSLEEVQQYLPDGHVDKIREFKKGDWVITTTVIARGFFKPDRCSELVIR